VNSGTRGSGSADDGGWEPFVIGVNSDTGTGPEVPRFRDGCFARCFAADGGACAFADPESVGETSVAGGG
jgi:hypothetical protein